LPNVVKVIHFDYEWLFVLHFRIHCSNSIIHRWCLFDASFGRKQLV